MAENQSQRDVLLQRLATLHNTTTALEGARVDALARKAQEEALKAQIDASDNAPAPVQPPATAPSRRRRSRQYRNPQCQTRQHRTRQHPSRRCRNRLCPSRPRLHPAACAQPPAPASSSPPVAAAGGAARKPTPPPAGSYTQVMVNYAMSKIGGPYQWGGNGPAGL